MQNNQSVIVIFGGTGMIGKSLLRRLCEKGYRIIIVTRSPYNNLDCKLAGNAGQIELEKNLNLFDKDKIKEILSSATFVINLVGVLYEKKRQSFDDIHSKFPAILASLCEDLNIKKLIHISALGVKKNNKSKYLKTKFSGEKNILKFKNSVVIRPSLVVGPNDKFTNKFAFLSQFSPFLPLVGGGKTKFSPVFVNDLASAIVAVLEKEEIKENIFEIGGAEEFTFHQLMLIILRQIKKKRFLLSIPWSMAKYFAKFSEVFTKDLLTQDQVIMLQDSHSVVSGQYPGLKDLNISPIRLETVLPDWIFRYREFGQFNKD